MIAQIKAARALAEAFAFEANEHRDDSSGALLTRFSAAYSRAAQSMEDQQRAELEVMYPLHAVAAPGEAN
jgi:hypothetical protein